MRKDVWWPVCLMIAVVALLAVACGDDDDDDSDEEEAPTAPATEEASDGEGSDPALTGDLTVFAAASLTDAFTEIGQALESQNDGLSVEFNFASSNALLTQIQEGAPADVYASAALDPMQTAADEGLLDGEPQVFSRNVPVVVVPANNPGGIEEVGDLANDGVSIVLAAEDVPIGTYARQIISNLAESPDYGAEFEEAVLGNVVSNETDVRAVLSKVELGEADAGIVYITDAQVSGDAVQAIEIPEEFNVIADYPIAVVVESDNSQAALAFVDFVLSEEGQAILNEYGFQPTG